MTILNPLTQEIRDKLFEDARAWLEDSVIEPLSADIHEMIADLNDAHDLEDHPSREIREMLVRTTDHEESMILSRLAGYLISESLARK